MKKFRHILAVGMATTMFLGSVLDVSAAGLMDIFDAEYYADSYADLKEAFGYDERQLYNHFITYGLKEGRNMSPILDVVAYREAYADLEAAFGDDWEAYVNHFLTFGAGEMRDRGVLFNPIIYADAYDDVKAAYGDDLMAIIRHYLIFGRAENRTIGTSNGYADMAAAGKAAQGAQQVTPDGASAPASASETPGTDVPGTDVPSGNALSVNAPGGNTSGSNTPGGNGGNSNKTSVIWTPKGEHYEYEYDERGNCISRTNYDDTGKKTWSTHYTYNSNNELVRKESRDSEGNCLGYDEYKYDGGKIKKIINYDGNGKVSFSTTYEWKGNTVKISEYDANGNPGNYKMCETDSRLNIIKEDCYTSGGELYTYYKYTYDKNDNVLTQICYLPNGTETSNNSFTYYENGTKKTWTNIYGGWEEVSEYNENGSPISLKIFYNGKLQEANTYEYYAEGPLAKESSNNCYGDGSSSYKEMDYDRQGRLQKQTKTEKESNGTISSKSEWVYEYAADGRHTTSFESYDSDGKLISKWSETYNAQNKRVNDISYTFSDGKVDSVTVKKCDENGRILSDSEYGPDGVTLRNATVYTYVETEYGYEQTIKELDADGKVLRTTGYMCDENDNHLGSKMPSSTGGFIMSWHGGDYKNQTWFYTAEGKLCRKEIKDDNNIMRAVYEYDEDGNEIALKYVNGNWVKPSGGSGTGVNALTTVLGSGETGVAALTTETGSEESESDETGSGETGSDESGSDETGSEETGSDESGSGETGSDETGSEESGSGETGSDETGSDESGSDETGSGESGSGETGSDETGSDETSSGESGSGESGSDETGSGESSSDETGSGKSGNGETGVAALTTESGSGKSSNGKSGSGESGSGESGNDAAEN